MFPSVKKTTKKTVTPIKSLDIFIGENRKIWILHSDSLPPGVNQMYKTGVKSSTNVNTGNEENHSVFFNSETAKMWKNSLGAIIPLSVGKNIPFIDSENERYGSFFWFSMFANYDADNKMKILNDSAQKFVIVNDKHIVRSSQYKTIVSKRTDIGFFYAVTDIDTYNETREKIENFIFGKVSDMNGNLLENKKEKTNASMIELCETLGCFRKIGK